MLEPGSSNAGGILVLSIGILALFTVTFVLYAISNWAALRAKYKTQKFPKNIQNIWHISKVGLLNIRLVSATDEGGIYLKVVFPYSLLWKPIYIPWADIQNINATSIASIIMPRKEASADGDSFNKDRFTTFEAGQITTIRLNKSAFKGTPLEEEVNKKGRK